MKDKRDYTGKTIFAGIDVHKKTYSVVVVCDKVIVKRDTLCAIPETLRNYFYRHFVGAKVNSAYEAGFSGFGLHRHLKEHGINNIVVHAASVEIGARDNEKIKELEILLQEQAKKDGSVELIYRSVKGIGKQHPGF